MSKTVGEYVAKNISELKKLHKLGLVSNTLINNFNIYTYYKGLNVKSMPSKMLRYQFTADSLKTSEVTVIRAVLQMEKSVK